MLIRKTIKWDITDRCNLRCAHCSVARTYFGPASESRRLSIAERRTVAERLVRAGVAHVSILGGEPLLLGEELFGILELFKSHHITTSVVTNGLLIDDRIAERLAGIAPERIVFSMEGPTPEIHDRMRGAGNFERLLHGITLIKQAIMRCNGDSRILINTVVTRHNKNHVHRMIPLTADLGADELSLLGLNIAGNATDNAGELVLSLQDELEVARNIAVERMRTADAKVSLKLQINFVYPLVSDYLLVTGGLDLPSAQVCCNAASSLGYINAWGCMHPCDRVFVGQHEKHFRNHGPNSQADSLVSKDFYDIWNSEYFLKLFQFVVSKEAYRAFTPCNHCAYFVNKQCNPCPLDALGTEMFPMRSCLFIEKQMAMPLNELINQAKKLRTEVAASTPHASEVADSMQESEAHGLRRTHPVLLPDSMIATQPGTRSAALGHPDLFVLIHPLTDEVIYVDKNGYTMWLSVRESPTSMDSVFARYLGEATKPPTPSYVNQDKAVVYHNMRAFLEDLAKRRFVTIASI